MSKKKLSTKPRTQSLKWKGALNLCIISFASIGTNLFALPIGIIGGQDQADKPYAALVSKDGTLTPIIGLPANVTTANTSTAMNGLGVSLIGGTYDTFLSSNSPQVGTPLYGYAGFVSAEGTLSLLSLEETVGILNTAINQAGNGLIGGAKSVSSDFNIHYAAFVSLDGTLTPLNLQDQGIILSTAINQANLGLIGGSKGSEYGVGYAAYVKPDGSVTPVSDSPLGLIWRVHLNEQGQGIIGGQDLSQKAYAAFVSPKGNAPLVLSPLPNALGVIQSVAINQAGMGLIGGVVADRAYAGYATAKGVVTPLLGDSFNGNILSVALNSSGTGLIGGYVTADATTLYAAFVEPNGSVRSLIQEPTVGEIGWVAINDAGIGLIGGQTGDSTTQGYAALVAPNGTLTVLNPSGTEDIIKVALALDAATPQSMGPYLSVPYTQLAASDALETRFLKNTRAISLLERSEIAFLPFNEDELTACNSSGLTAKPKRHGKSEQTPASSAKNSVWMAPFGNYVHLSEQGTTPSYTNEIGGVLVAYDHEEAHYLVGACLGYAFNYIDYSENSGHAKIQEEMTSVYGSYLNDHVRVNSALWGGFYQLWNTRHTLGSIESKSKTHGWILSPHLEIASPWNLDQNHAYQVEPFCAFDWVNSWQNQQTETGSAGLNLHIAGVYGSLLQSEVGVRFYECFEYSLGTFVLEEKASYVNQAPFYPSSISTTFAGAASSFPIAVGSSHVENLGALQVMGSFKPKNTAYPYGGFSLQAMANGSYQSYFVSLFTGMDF